MRILVLAALIAGQLLAVEPAKKLKIVTTMQVLAAISQEIGGSLVELNSLSGAAEDPHFVKAKPSFKKWVSDADLFIQVGRSLELWVPQVISASANQKLISGERLIIASLNTKALEVPNNLSRTNGDIHPQGNPHLWLGPSSVLKMADNIKHALIKADPLHKSSYEKNFASFKQKLSVEMFGQDLVGVANNLDLLWRLHEGKKLKQYALEHKKSVGGWLKQAELIDYSFISYHSEFSYLADEFDLKIMGQIEEKSGVAPGLRYQNELTKKALANHVKHIVAASYYTGSSKLIDLVASKINGQRIFVTVDCLPAESYLAMMNRLLKALVDFRAVQPPKVK